MKKLLSFAGVALLALIGVVGCDDDAVVTPVAPPPTPAPIFGTVSGTVSVEGSGLAGVIVNLSGAASQSASTGSSGGYSFDNVPAGTHSVQISGAPDEVTFGSIAAAVTIATSGQAATADFSGNYIRTSIIEGSVTAGGEGVVATVTASGAGRLMSEQANSGSSNADGDFELTGLRAGTYHVEISQFPEGIEFLVTMRDVTVGVGLSANASFDAPGEDGPTTDTGMSILITGVTDAGDDDGKYSGRVTATIDVERGEFEKIALYVDGAEVAAQLFGLGPAPAGEPPLAAQEGVIFSLSFNSAKYGTDIGPDLGKVTYPNGAHEIVAGVTAQGSTEETYSNRMEVEFDNPDGVHALAILPGDPVFNSDTGEGWYGGPDAGIVVGGTLVSYSGDVVGSLTLLNICGNKAITDSEAPFVFDELECDETRVLTQEDDIFRIAERKVGILNHEGVFPIRLDYEGPEAPTFAANPNERTGGWINGTVDLTGKQLDDDNSPKHNPDGWLNYNDKDEANKGTDDHNPATNGVGGYTVQLRSSTTTPSIVDGALGAAASSSPTLPAATEKADEICFIATAVDALGNESDRPDAGDNCAAGTVPSNVIQAGVDITAPTIAFSGTSPKADARELTSEFQLQVKDEAKASGLHDNPVLARVQLRNAKDEMICGDDDEEKKDLPGNEDIRGNCLNTVDGFAFDEVLGLATTTGVTSAPKTAYYTFTAIARDNAGNHSEPVSQVALHDDEGPKSLIGGSFDPAKAVYNLIVSVTDDFSIRDYYVALNFSTDLEELLGIDEEDDLPVRFRVRDPVVVDAYNSALSQKTDPSGAYNAVLALQGTTFEAADADDPDDQDDHGVAAFSDANALASIAIRARDQSEGNKGYSEEPSLAGPAPTTGFPQAIALVATQTGLAPTAGGILSFTFEADEKQYDLADAVKLTAEVVGYSRDAKGPLVIMPAVPAAGDTPAEPAVTAADVTAIPFRNPFKRVDFYAETADELRFIASVSGPTGTKSDKTVDDDDDGVDDAADENADNAEFDTPGDEDDDVDGAAQALSITAERANTDNQVTFSYEVTVSAADLYAALQDSGKGNYGGRIIAIGVGVEDKKNTTTPAGVGLVSQAFKVMIEK